MGDAQARSRGPRPHPGHVDGAILVHAKDEAQVLVLEVGPVASAKRHCNLR